MGEVGMGSNYFDFYDFKNREILVESLSKRIITNLTDAVKKKGYATLVLSGGSTPKNLLKELSQVTFDWAKVRVTLVDERWVDSKSDESNEKLIRECLLQNSAKDAKFYPLKTDEKSAKDGISSLEVTLEEFFGELDVVILGMGLDAHTASFFPHAVELSFALNTNDLVCATTASVLPKERVTLSKSYLLSTQNLLLHIEGEKKKEVFDKASQSDNISNMPIITMMHQKSPLLEVYYAN
ncbi:MAG: 6-phosphogluconolactonase [Campylobacterota bacterium]|nr:6-phosphogluconolactonase [Campylobacterota bacterium]